MDPDPDIDKIQIDTLNDSIVLNQLTRCGWIVLCLSCSTFYFCKRSLVCVHLACRMAPDELPDLCLDFSVATEEFGRVVVRELKPGGEDIDVTAENRWVG